uniref:Long-chain fatty acid transporter n=1 Tax=Vitiosangium cumulatum TaxID=1867796 RepID=A0A7D5CGZ8_9BACT|nr:long-chain fatty acid transporter [Vitiosangium cumulatum]
MKKTLTVVTLLAASASQAAGLTIDTQSGRATGMGSTGVASSVDASSIYYNPAGILGVNKLDALLGASFIIANLGFTPEGGTKQTQTTPSPPPHAYFAYKLSDQLALGVGVFTPYGANIKWPDDFVGRQIAKSAKVATYDINPTVGFAPVKWLRIGAGAQILYGTVDLERALIFAPTTEGSVKLSTNDWGFGYNLGVQVDVMPGLLTLGATYRSWVKMYTRGEADFDVPAPFSAVLVDQPVKLDVTMPSTVGLGASVTPIEKLTLAVDVNWVDWSTIDELLFELENPPPTLPNTPVPKNWKDTWSFHIGGEYKPTADLALRLGFIYDPTPTPEDTLTPELPDATRLNFTAGIGYKHSHFRADLGYHFVQLLEQRSTSPVLPGTYSGTAHVIGLTLGYSQ